LKDKAGNYKQRKVLRASRSPKLAPLRGAQCIVFYSQWAYYKEVVAGFGSGRKVGLHPNGRKACLSGTPGLSGLEVPNSWRTYQWADCPLLFCVVSFGRFATNRFRFPHSHGFSSACHSATRRDSRVAQRENRGFVSSDLFDCITCASDMRLGTQVGLAGCVSGGILEQRR
jgi:hypothetical protein